MAGIESAYKAIHTNANQCSVELEITQKAETTLRDKTSGTFQIGQNTRMHFLAQTLVFFADAGKQFGA